MATIYNSRSATYKTPFGAVPSGENVTFRLLVPPEIGCTQPRLFLQPDGGQALPQTMNSAGTRDGCDVFCCTISAPQAGLYFYWFDLWVNYTKIYRGPGGEGVLSTGQGQLYQLTVYDPAFTTPKNLGGGVMYQIFPDRFFEGNPVKPNTYNERIYRKDKQDEPYFWPTDQMDGKLTLDYFGGDLVGIEKKLPYLHTLGVSWLYLNPIFEAHSNHRYNTADYMNIDPYLGTNQDFERLCKKAGEYGIRIILDGVFSHTGSDSIYFNREGRYPSLGAWQGRSSPYRDWYIFHPDGSYDCWWGFDTLPTCNKADPGFRHFILGEGGVVDTWLQRGAAGFRLDVADDLPDDFIAGLRQAVKRHGEDKLLIGEVWEDASHKISYGGRRRYFLGQELDGVMNYPFMEAILAFLKTFDAAAFAEGVMTIVENYPAPAMAACTTHLSTHDTVRFITSVAGEEVDSHDRNWQSMRRLTPDQYHLGITRLILAFVLQFMLPGIPCVYYGDEIAMQGYKDPFNRAYFDWTSGEDRLIPLMKTLSNLRKKCPAFWETGIRFTRAENGVLAFERLGGGKKAAVGVNCSGQPVTISLLGKEIEIPMMGYAVQIEE